MGSKKMSSLGGPTLKNTFSSYWPILCWGDSIRLYMLLYYRKYVSDSRMKLLILKCLNTVNNLTCEINFLGVCFTVQRGVLWSLPPPDHQQAVRSPGLQIVEPFKRQNHMVGVTLKSKLRTSSVLKYWILVWYVIWLVLTSQTIFYLNVKNKPKRLHMTQDQVWGKS